MSNIQDDNFYRYAGYEQSNTCIKEYFSHNTICMISDKITQLLIGVHPSNKQIKVSDKVIAHVMSQIQDTFRPTTGSIQSRYTIPDSGDEPESYIQNMISQVIELIVSNVKNDYMMEENNKKLSVWDSVLGTFNKNQLLAHPPIKINNNRPASFQFNMNY
ncbi:MAG: hypothetical protein ACW98X_21300 [Promethearchaeota archaeon]|jgi:hypothetical protein